MRSLRSHSLWLVLLLISCSPLKRSSLTQAQPEVDHPEWESPFLRNFDKALFKATMDVKGRHLTGLVLIKKTSDTSYHFSFANEIGMTYFDLELFKDHYRADYVFAPLNKKAFIKILHHDFCILFFSEHSVGHPRHYTDPATLDDVYYYSSAKLFIQLSRNSGKLTRMAGWSNLFDGVLIGFDYETDPFPIGINILNPRIGLIFDLNFIGR